MKNKILFISHEATRTGAPLILLNVLKWLNRNVNNIQFDILLMKGGVIEEDLIKECSNVFFYSELHKPIKFSKRVNRMILSKLGIREKNKEDFFLENIALNNYDLIYANSIVTIPIAIKIKTYSHNTKLLVHVHELDTIIKMVFPDLNNDIDGLIAVSNQVKNNLVNNFGVDKNLIDVIYEFGVVEGDGANKIDETFTVGASGNAHWRKGDDVFLQVANNVIKNNPDAKINFVWVGNNLSNKLIIDADINKLGLKNQVLFVGEQTNPIKFYRNFDLFLLTSREDPFPLVCIEVANLKKPIICFDKASGTTEIIEKGGGFIVPYLDIQAMSEKIIFYYDNPDKMNKDGEKAQQLFAEFTSEKICPLIYKKINSLIKKQNIL